MTSLERITFTADGLGDGLELVGDLRLPDGPGPFPAVALTGPFTGVKEQVTGLYAQLLTRSGFATLAFDHRGFGESPGRHGHEDSQGKLADLRGAVRVLADRTEVAGDRIALVGICLGAGYAVRVAAMDPRVRAVAGIAGAYNSPAWFAGKMGIDAYRSALSTFLDRYYEPLPAVAPRGGEAAMPGQEPYAYYGTERGASPHWRNQVTRGSLYSLMTFDALSAAELLGATPLLVVHGKVDDYCSPELARAMYQRAAGHKEISWLDCEQHIDLYDVSPFVGQAGQATADFLHRHLG
ncbi:alpha/beta hydrolase [Streptomyces sp. NBC_01537]|uniref:alpha/beta hydrolase n=1 Tax=Streptomyces sp. NBC_01537 TaxID=2903896 RepID=UPI00386CF064